MLLGWQSHPSPNRIVFLEAEPLIGIPWWNQGTKNKRGID
jgi:hypothetical protein